MSRAEITTPEIMPEESVVELSLRPQRLSEFIGQDRVKESLRIHVDAALVRREPLDRTLFCGPPPSARPLLPNSPRASSALTSATLPDPRSGAEKSG
jgi:Holliday junction resolvasome RuvABC ATP-dependent DNA helicase subunit